MATLTGSTKDFRPQPLGSTASVIITPFGPAASSSKSLLVSKPIIVTPASDGTFSVDLASYAGTNPPTAYHVRVEWLDSAGNYSAGEDFPWPLVVTGDGALVDMFAIPTATGYLTKGDKGDNGDSVMQAAFDALVARLPQPGEDDKFQVAFEDGRMGFQVTNKGVHLGDTIVEPSEEQGVVDEDGRFLMRWDTSTGETIIYKPVFPNGGGGVGGSNIPVTVLHTFLAVGQSNMSGRGLPSGGSYDPVDPRLFQYGAKNRTFRAATVPLDMHDPASGLSPATTFARNYLAMQPANVGVLLIPAAHGGTGFTGSTSELTWSVGVATNPTLDLPELAVAQTLEGIAAAKAAGYTVELKGALWHQGENNSSLSTSGYAAKLDELIAFFRTRLSSPKLPFVAGQMSPETIATVTGRDGIDRAHYETPARVAYTGFARAMAGGVNVGETVHFSRVGVEYLGKTYLSGYWQAVGNVLAAAPGDPVGLTATKSGTTVTATWDAPPESLTRDVAYSLYGGGETYTWNGPQSRITGYKVEVKTGAGAWAEVSRYSTMRLYETITGVPAGTTQVRVTALNGAAASTTKTVTATGA